MSGGFSVSDLGFSAYSDLVRRAGQERAVSEPTQGVTREQLRVLADSFEKIILGMMMESMRDSVPESDLLPQEPGHDAYRQMLDQQWVEAGSGGRLSEEIAQALERQYAHLLVERGGEVSGEASEPQTHRDQSTERRMTGS
ncbi:rod-binding protein [Candidatus Sumerlaeota bacterium]|nr:rod-binding protein [Candidatus Sumerlaeota bacterium]